MYQFSELNFIYLLAFLRQPVPNWKSEIIFSLPTAFIEAVAWLFWMEKVNEMKRDLPVSQSLHWKTAWHTKVRWTEISFFYNLRNGVLWLTRYVRYWRTNCNGKKIKHRYTAISNLLSWRKWIIQDFYNMLVHRGLFA